MVYSPIKIDRRKREEALLASDPDEVMEAIEDEVSTGLGLAGFCQLQDVRYRVVLAWIQSDATRALRYQQAEAARASYSFEAATAIGRKLADPDKPTGVDWLDGSKHVLEAKAARVAHEALRWGATVGDRSRFGKTVRHEHTMHVEHLQALKARVISGRGAHLLSTAPVAPARQLGAPIEVEFVPSPRAPQAQRTQVIDDPIAQALRIRVCYER